MRRTALKILLCSAVALGLPKGHAAPTAPRITEITPILIGKSPVTLHPKGFPAITVTPFWRENGNAWGYHLYAVTTPDAEQPDQADLVDRQDAAPNAPLADMLADSPHTGEDAIQTVHFATARVNGKSSLLLFIATRDMGGHPVPQPSPAHVRIYQLTREDGEPGTTAFTFRPLSTIASPVTTCHADIALRAATKIPFATWNGPHEPVPTCPQ
ncbi:hypothetical protein [Gluconobacter albidus]|uniref:Uncharacterized protein n=1 Tax=Gluconobacter albidus TaxID=318683 RepID=A0ABQ5X3Z7_9PROT|nr:hypothetical protein [Gluconobacter albidus]GBQ83328.1 hypothetical protein AA3250_0235 [Gluconobacter albidus NBRC 3250]GLQ70568.1 hypothetical protein GCM10007866_30210 [Gluconobacter albidus]